MSLQNDRRNPSTKILLKFVGPEEIPYQIGESTTVSHIVAFIEENFKINPRFMKLYYNGKNLESAQTLKSYGIEDFDDIIVLNSEVNNFVESFSLLSRQRIQPIRPMQLFAFLSQRKNLMLMKAKPNHT